MSQGRTRLQHAYPGRPAQQTHTYPHKPQPHPTGYAARARPPAPLGSTSVVPRAPASPSETPGCARTAPTRAPQATILISSAQATRLNPTCANSAQWETAPAVLTGRPATSQQTACALPAPSALPASTTAPATARTRDAAHPALYVHQDTTLFEHVGPSPTRSARMPFATRPRHVRPSSATIRQSL